MTTAVLESSYHPLTEHAAPRGELAAALQEAFTVAVRLRAGRQVATDSGSFRAQIKQLLASADQRARAAGYSGPTVKQAVYAYIALLDESVLNAGSAMFADWSRQPLQEEVFGEHMAGENFFRALQELLGRQDSDEVADLLEVFQLCLLLGFHGRYGADAMGLRTLEGTVKAKIQRIRGGQPITELAPDWRRPQNERVVAGADPWARRLVIIAGAMLVLTAVLYVLYRVVLNAGVNNLQSLI
jgi:type VI secretion system protein ImpK